uniref:M61 family metallopeptidase n=1 Tax=Polaribacter sp. TaxID=1920175 RepID=UPI004047AFBC
MKKLFMAIAMIAIISSCSTSKIAQNQKKEIAVAIDLINVVNDKVKVTVDPQKIKENTLVYQIPAIVPGTYAISDYGKFISEFKAFDYKGNELAVVKVDTNSWQINNATQMDKISYWVEDTFDSELKHNIYVMAGTNIEKDQNFLLNLPGFVGYFQNKKETPYTISISHPEKLYETTSLINSNTTKTENTLDVFTASRYDEISDNPIMYAPLNNVSFVIDGIEVNFAVYSPNNVHHAKDMEADLKKMVQAQSNFLKGFKTTKEYNILLYLFDSNIYKWTSFGALEHLSSTTVVYPENFSKKQLADGMINGTVSHEFFHIVSPLSVHSEEIHYFDFNTPKMSQHLWMYEGMTEYFANLFQVNQGLISEQEFIDEMSGKIKTSLRFNDAMSFTEMSKNILEPEFAKNYSNVYMKGALIGMSLDILLREESKGAYGVRSMMKDLSSRYGQNKPFKDDEIIAEIVAMTYPSVGEFFRNHVQGNTPISYEEFFAKVGIKKGTQEVDSRYFVNKINQPFLTLNATRDLIFTPKLNTGLVALGVQAGDILKAINGEVVNLQNINPILVKTFDWEVGDAISVEVLRDGKTLKLEGTAIQPKSVEEGLILEDLPKNDPKFMLREAWLKG